METKYLKNVWNLLVWIRCRYIKGSKSQISNNTFQQLSLGTWFDSCQKSRISLEDASTVKIEIAGVR